MALGLHARRHGFRVRFLPDGISIARGHRSVLLRTADFTLVPIMLEDFESFFRTVEAAPDPRAGGAGGEAKVLDFSRPGPHRYLRTGVELVFPGIAEDDSTDAYTHRFRPSEGMVVLDIGAHAGLTSYHFSKMVGESGRVFAFEPDDTSRRFLQENIERHSLKNVVVLDCAVSDRTGRSMFNMDGSMGAGLVDFIVYPATGARREVQVVTLEEACRRIERRPDFVKMDIEGAELAVVQSSLEFISRNPMHFAFDSYHRTPDGSLTCQHLENLFRSIGYRADSSAEFGEMFTWATPPAGAA